MYGRVSGRLIVASALVLLALAVVSSPLGSPISRAQTPQSPVRTWRCLAVVGSPLGQARPDPTCASTSARTPSLHLSAPSALRTAAPLVVAGPPTAFAASVSGHSVALSWTAPASGDAPASYVLEAGSSSGLSDLANTDTGSSLAALTATDVPAGSYYVRVRARSAAGTSAPSNEIVVTVTGTSPCAAAPGAPAALSAVVTGTSLTLTWQAPAGGCAPAAYVIDAGSAPGLSNLASFSTGNNSTSFSAGGIGAGTYYVRVRSSNGGRTSASSNEAQFSVGGGPCSGALGAPTGLTASANGTTVVLGWTAPSGAVLSFIIEAGSSPGSSNLVVSDTGSAATLLTATAGAGTYYVRVRTRTACGTSAPSNEATLVVTGDAGPGGDTLSIVVSDMGGGRLVRITDMNGANWQTGPVAAGLSFHNPWHIAFDTRGRIYVADRDHNRIVRMDDLAGNGWTAFSGIGANMLGAPGCSGLSNPPVGCVISVAVDAAGRIYVVTSGRLVRIDDMTGAGWTTLANGPTTFDALKVVILDHQGRILMTDTGGYRLVRFDDMQGSGRVTFGSRGSGVGQFNRPEGLAIDALGRIYISDNDNSRIVRINDMTGAGWVSFGSFGSISPTGPVTSAAVGHFAEPHDLAVSDSMKIYIADTGNGRIVRIDDMTGAGWTAFGSRVVQAAGPGSVLPGHFEFLSVKGIRLWQGHP
jgi:sugar lactone lactonase YvrE